MASSFLSVAISQVYGSALNGRCADRPELADTAIPLHATLAVVKVRGGETFLRALFEPLGYTVQAQRHPLDPNFPEWGDSRYFTVDLTGTTRLQDLLSHIYVLIPVLDDDKHYWVSRDEVAKLLQRGEGWLAQHPQKEEITNRYLIRQRGLAREALTRLQEEDAAPESAMDSDADAAEEAAEKPIGLHQQRLDAVLAILKESGANRVLDLGCGEAKLLRLLLREKQFSAIVGMDVSPDVLDRAAQRLRLETMPDRQRARINLIHGFLIYRDKRLAGFDAAAVVEVIEHLDSSRLAAFERVLFEYAHPRMIVLTTPNREYNSQWPSLPAGQFRHRDHRFEWTRDEFAAWAQGVAERFDYRVNVQGIGPEVEAVGTPTQMAVFEIL